MGEHALRWRGSDDYFFKVGLNHPEVFLEYADFDNTASTRTYDAHVGDWQPGDPTWQETKGKGIVGVVNYLAVRGMNVHYFIVMNSRGDGKQAFPWNTSEDVWNYDVSKLDQWQIVMDHMMSKGIMAAHSPYRAGKPESVRVPWRVAGQWIRGFAQVVLS